MLNCFPAAAEMAGREGRGPDRSFLLSARHAETTLWANMQQTPAPWPGLGWGLGQEGAFLLALQAPPLSLLSFPVLKPQPRSMTLGQLQAALVISGTQSAPTGGGPPLSLFPLSLLFSVSFVLVPQQVSRLPYPKHWLCLSSELLRVSYRLHGRRKFPHRPPAPASGAWTSRERREPRRGHRDRRAGQGAFHGKSRYLPQVCPPH